MNLQFKIRKVYTAFLGCLLCSSLVFLTPFLLPVLAASAQEQKGTMAASDLCYAFIRNDDIWTVCGGKREQLHVPARISAFAVSTDTTYLAYYAWKSSGHRKMPLRQDLYLVSLKPGFKTTLKEAGVKPSGLFGTCGTILKDDSDRSRGMVDILPGQRRELAQVGFLQCNFDRRVVGLWARAEGGPGGDLVVSVDGKEKLRQSHAGGDFKISPSGKYLAYIEPDAHGSLDLEFCLYDFTASPGCYAEGPLGLITSPITSLSDAGEILYVTESHDSCGEAGMCPGLGYWRPGMAKGVVIEDQDTGNSQWITPEAAARLHEWASRAGRP